MRLNKYLNEKYRQIRLNWWPDTTIPTCLSLEYKILSAHQKMRNRLKIIWLLFKVTFMASSILYLRKVARAICNQLSHLMRLRLSLRGQKSSELCFGTIPVRVYWPILSFLIKTILKFWNQGLLYLNVKNTTTKCMRYYSKTERESLV